jgi:hypothetical protein
MTTHAYVHEATIIVSEGTNPAAVGAEVTNALCGRWDHDGPCRWPHNNHIEDTRFRTIFIATDDDEPEVRRRIRAALSNQSAWRMEADSSRDVAESEKDLAEQLFKAPRLG